MRRTSTAEEEYHALSLPERRAHWTTVDSVEGTVVLFRADSPSWAAALAAGYSPHREVGAGDWLLVRGPELGDHVSLSPVIEIPLVVVNDEGDLDEENYLCEGIQQTHECLTSVCNASRCPLLTTATLV